MEKLMDSGEPLIVRYLHQKAGRMKLPVNVSFELTSRCNFSCKMCYVHNADCSRNKPYELTARQWIDVATQAKEAGALFVLITGGEPMLREDFNEIYEAVAKMGFVLSLNTNLSLLKEDTIDLLAKYRPNRVNVSLYGADNATYAALCGVPAFDRVAENIKKLQERGVPVKINSSITQYNIASAGHIARFCDDNGLNLKSTAYMFPAARLKESRERLSPKQVAEYRALADFHSLSPEKFEDRTQRIVNGVAFERDRDCPEIETKEQGIRCRAGSSSAWIDWRGNMSFCGMVPAPAENSVLRLGYDACWQKTVKAAQAVRLPKKCASCVYRHLCHICAAAQLCETGGFDEPPAYVCEISSHVPQAYQSLLEKRKKGENG